MFISYWVSLFYLLSDDEITRRSYCTLITATLSTKLKRIQLNRLILLLRVIISLRIFRRLLQKYLMRYTGNAVLPHSRHKYAAAAHFFATFFLFFAHLCKKKPKIAHYFHRGAYTKSKEKKFLEHVFIFCILYHFNHEICCMTTVNSSKLIR